MVSRTVLNTGFMFRRPARNSWSYVGSIEIPCESTPRRSVSTIMSAVVSACASDMPHARKTLASCSWIFFDATRIATLRGSMRPACSLDRRIGTRDESLRKRKAHRLRGLQVDHELEHRGL